MCSKACSDHRPVLTVSHSPGACAPRNLKISPVNTGSQNDSLHAVRTGLCDEPLAAFESFILGRLRHRQPPGQAQMQEDN